MVGNNFDAMAALRKRLAYSLGLKLYAEIMTNVRQTNIATDGEFQKKFDAFYRVRRNEAWRGVYYALFEELKGREPTFEYIIRHMYEKTGNIEASFSSKMLATLCPDKPIWDRYVLEKLGLKLEGKNKEEKLQNAISLYEKIENQYHSFLSTEKADECIDVFDEMFCEYKWISPIKKIDYFLWSVRE